MYIWKTGSLSKDIKSGLVGEKDWKGYYIFISILVYLSMYLMAFSPRVSAASTLVEGLAMIAILVLGVGITYKSNKGDEGSDYIPRITALSVPITVKLFIISFAALVLFGIISEVMSFSEMLKEWFAVVAAIVIQIVFFWRLNLHIKFINS